MLLCELRFRVSWCLSFCRLILFQSVLAQASPPMSNGDLAGKLHGAHLTIHSKKQGVSGESSHLDGRNMTVTAPKFEKDFR